MDIPSSHRFDQRSTFCGKASFNQPAGQVLNGPGPLPIQPPLEPLSKPVLGHLLLVTTKLRSRINPDPNGPRQPPTRGLPAKPIAVLPEPAPA